MVRRLALFAVGALALVSVGSVVTAGAAAAAGDGPVVKHLTPHHGLRGTAVAVEGTNLNGASAVAFGGVHALSFHVVSGKAIIARAPSGSGTVDVTVTTPNGTSTTSPKDEFTYDVPLVRSVQPRQGPAGGGTRVTVTGERLNGATAVDFNGTPATDVHVYTSHLLTAVSPAGTSGTVVDVTVTTPVGTSSARRSDRFAYSGQGPLVTGVSPHRGALTGGTPVVIHGKNLTGTSAVSFGPNMATDVLVVSDHVVSATAPAGTGTVHVTVTTPGGTSTPSTADTFTYADLRPVVKRIAPRHGPAAGGKSVVITGHNLSGASAVDFGSTPASFHVVSGKIIVATAPAGTSGTTVDVTVTTPNGASATSSKDQFTYR